MLSYLRDSFVFDNIRANIHLILNTLYCPSGIELSAGSFNDIKTNLPFS